METINQIPQEVVEGSVLDSNLEQTSPIASTDFVGMKIKKPKTIVNSGKMFDTILSIEVDHDQIPDYRWNAVNNRSEMDWDHLSLDQKSDVLVTEATETCLYYMEMYPDAYPNVDKSRERLLEYFNKYSKDKKIQ